ncbi:MAG: hypothetical protein AAFV62_12295 [Pseudomonadota bacterium]
MGRLTRCAACIGLAVLVLSGCARTAQTPDLVSLYRRTAEAGVTQRNPLVVVPGTLGSRLVDVSSGELVWGGEGFSADPDTDEGIEALALPVGDGETPLSALRDDVEPAGLLDKARVNVLGAVIEEGIYDGITQTLLAGGYGRVRSVLFNPTGAAEPTEEVTPDAPLIGPDSGLIYTYDWRRDLVETAQRLYRRLSAKRDRIYAERAALPYQLEEPRPVRFDLVAHSMGGLAVRYFLLYGDAPLPNTGPLPPITWKGADLVEKVVFVGTPHAGSVTAFENLVNGKSFSPITPDFQASLLATHPSVYQLMPRDRHARAFWETDAPTSSLYDLSLWQRYRWGLLGADADRTLQVLLPDVADPQERYRLAEAHLDRLLRRAQRFHSAIDRAATPPPALDQFLVVGGGFETPQSVMIERETGAVTIRDFAEGDGVVLRSSVLMDERVGNRFQPGLRSPLRFRATLFLPDEHVELTKSEVFGDNLLFWLLEEPRRLPEEQLRNPRLASASSAGEAEAQSITGLERNDR